MMALLYILGGLICLVIWPAFYVFRYHKETDHALKCNAMLFSPSVLLLSSYLLWFGQQQNVPSIACGMVQGYHTYMSSGNANKRKSFERVEILFDRVKYARHLRLDETIVKANVGTRICFEFYDLKLNTHLQDSTLIRWIE
ncbi:hypothetical protein [Acinetobacter tianfuensis]|uniref:Uncharacterized protein n=1 Tax=Acinetobacter tianfuensis TaxID=2419603 RepID=A0A3A8ERB4_9GAMM|nr:hypothetical protein [Acinetobacter tianfuensis]RKG31421.1 hypothetical protein D7V32_08120 [Acinetobacter tianfuensis]